MQGAYAGGLRPPLWRTVDHCVWGVDGADEDTAVVAAAAAVAGVAAAAWGGALLPLLLLLPLLS
jgi:hypothetical protein